MAETNVRGLTPNPLAPPEWVEIQHSDVEATNRVHPRSLPHWESRGWSVVKASGKQAPETDATSKKQGA